MSGMADTKYYRRNFAERSLLVVTVARSVDIKCHASHMIIMKSTLSWDLFSEDGLECVTVTITQPDEKRIAPVRGHHKGKKDLCSPGNDEFNLDKILMNLEVVEVVNGNYSTTIVNSFNQRFEFQVELKPNHVLGFWGGDHWVKFKGFQNYINANVSPNIHVTCKYKIINVGGIHYGVVYDITNWECAIGHGP